tara:strand:+ start:470 stop:970 length:501 start_codon:yes stop_codon:yes gene_type:complete
LPTDGGGASEADVKEADVKEARQRRGGAAPPEIVKEPEIRQIIKKLKDSEAYGGLVKMVNDLLVLQVDGCIVGDQSAFKTWLKLAKDEARSLAEGTDAVAVLLELIEDVDGTLTRMQGNTPLNAKMEAEQDAVREIVPKARQHPALVHNLPTHAALVPQLAHHPCL